MRNDFPTEKRTRIRTIREALKEIKTIDPNTAVTYSFIRRLCDSNAVSFLRAGKKILINFDQLLDLLSKGNV